MKKFLWLLVVLLVAANGLWAQFYANFSSQERRELGESYYLVAKQYSAQGETQKARDFEQMAYNIYPSLDPAKIQVRDLPSAAALILEGKARLAAAPRARAEATQELIKGRFLRLVSAFLRKDAPGMLELMDGSVYFTDLNVELSQAQIESQLNVFFAKTDLSGLAPSEVWDLGSLSVSAVSGPWGETYAVRIRAKEDFSKQVAFWKTDQQYLVRRYRNQWLLFSVGQRTPPAAWTPKTPPPERAAAALPKAGPEPEIKAALLACLDTFLKKQVDQASMYFAREVEIIRLGTSLSRQEIAATFEGYFEGTDFTGVKAQDVLDANSIFVEPTERFAEKGLGEVYLLTVKTRLDLSDKIPFWTRFQDYYFGYESDGKPAWRIFAIF
jgi:hypothetical protein